MHLYCLGLQINLEILVKENLALHKSAKKCK